VLVNDYFRESEQLFRGYAYSKVVGRMAPSLRKTIAVHIHGESLYKIWFFNSEERKEREEFTAAVALVLTPCAYPPNEIIYSAGHLASFMSIVVRGLANQSSDKVGHMKQLGKGASYGEEMILSRSLRPDSVRAITYLNCNKLERDDLMRLLAESHGAFPHTVALIRKATCKLALRRAVKSIARMCRMMRVTKHSAMEHSESERDSLRNKEKTEMVSYKKGLMRWGKEKSKAAQVKMRSSGTFNKGTVAPRRASVIRRMNLVEVQKKAETDLKSASHQLAHFTSPALVMHLVGNVEHMEGIERSNGLHAAAAAGGMGSGDGSGSGSGSGSSGFGGPPKNGKSMLSAFEKMLDEDEDNSVGSQLERCGHGNSSNSGPPGSGGSESESVGGGGAPVTALLDIMSRMENKFTRMQHQIDEQGNVLRALHRDTQDLKTKL